MNLSITGWTSNTDEEGLEDVRDDIPTDVEQDSPAVSDLVMDHRDNESDNGGSRWASRRLAKEPGEEVGIYVDQLESGRSQTGLATQILKSHHGDPISIGR